MNPDLTPSQRRTLQVAPLWVLSAIVGRQSGFEPRELAAFWRALDETATGADGLAAAVLTALSDDFTERITDYENEQRSVVTGLWDVTSILGTQDPLVGLPFVAALLEVGERLSRARLVRSGDQPGGRPDPAVARHAAGDRAVGRDARSRRTGLMLNGA